MTGWRTWAARRFRDHRPLVIILVCVIALTTTVLTVSIGSSGLLAARAAQEALTDPATGDAGLRVQSRQSDDLGAQDLLVRTALTENFAPVDVDIWTAQVSEPRPANGPAGQLTDSLTLMSADYLTSPNLTLAEGHWPSDAGEAALQKDAAEKLGVAVGTQLQVEGMELTVTGLWNPADSNSSLWLRDPLMLTGSDGATIGPLIVDPQVIAATDSPFMRWVVVPDVAQITPDQLSLLSESATRASASVKDIDPSGRGVTVTGDLAQTASRAARDADTGSAFAAFPLSLVILIAVVGLSQVAALLTNARAAEDALLVARGAGFRQMGLVSLAESLAVSLVGAAIGTALAAGCIAVAGGGAAQLPQMMAGGIIGFAISLSCVAVSVTTAHIRALRGTTVSSDRIRRLAGGVAMVLVGVLAAVSTWQLLRAQGFVRLGEEAVSVDLVAAMSPTLLLAGAAVAALVVAMPVTRLLAAWAHRFGTVRHWLGLTQVARGLPLHAVAIALTVVATGTATYAALFSATSVGLARDVAALTQAAPLRADLDGAFDPSTATSPIRDSTLVWREDRAQLGDTLLPLVVLPVDTAAGIASLPTGAGLPPVEILRPSDDADITIPPGSTTLDVTLASNAWLDPWQEGVLATWARQAFDDLPSGTDRADAVREVHEALSGWEEAVTPTVTVDIRHQATGVVRSIVSSAAPIPAGSVEITADTATLRGTTSSARFQLTLPEGTWSISGVTVTLERPLSEWVTWRFDIGISSGGTSLLDDRDSTWGSPTGFPAAQAEGYRRAEAAALPVTVTDPSDPEILGLVTNEPPRPSAEVDLSSETWTITLRGPTDTESTPTLVRMAPGAQFVGEDPLALHHTSPTPRIPVAITRATAESSSLTIGDRVDLQAFGLSIPGTVAAITEVVPSVPGPQAVMIDAIALSRHLTARTLTMPEPNHMWATFSGDAIQARDFVSHLDSVSAVTVSDSDNGGTAQAASDAVWVASGCAMVLAVAGLSASVASATGARRREVAVLRALGMSPSAQASSRAIETVIVLLLAGSLGVLGGLGAATVTVRPIALSATVADPSFSIFMGFSWLPWLVVLASGAVLSAAIIAWQLLTVRRQALTGDYREEVR